MRARLIGLMTVVGAGLMPAQGLAEVTPDCVKPGATVTMTGTQVANAATAVKIFANPDFIDLTTLENGEGAPQADWTAFGTFSLTGGTTLNAVLKVPMETTYKGAPIDGWVFAAVGTDDAGTNYGTIFDGAIDLNTEFALITHKVKKGGPMTYRVGGPLSARPYVFLTKGKKTIKKQLTRARGTAPCRAASGKLYTSDLAKGTYKVKFAGTASGAGSISAGTLKVT